MDYLRILTGKETPLPIYSGVIACLENPLAFPDLLEPIYREAMKLDDDTLDRFRFSLMRLHCMQISTGMKIWRKRCTSSTLRRCLKK